jgi:hypothetical protein
MSDPSVNEATAALKGLLGIGGGSVVQTPIKDDTGKTKGPKKGKGGKQETPKRNKQADRSQSNPKSANSRGAKTKEKKPPQAENFAWSAFQSSPDPSSLPIPAFMAPANSLNIDESTTQLDSNKLPSVLTGLGEQQTEPPPIELMNAPRAEDLEAQQIASAEKATETPKTVELQPETPKKEKPEPEEEKQNSASGINLAALAASPAQPHSAPSPRNPGTSLPPQLFSSPQPQFSSPGPYRTPPQPQSPYLPPSPSYVTIQVQVPPVLGPDRRMVVHSPAGYPVQILVPEGVPPGMVIPVHVPAGPMIQSPYYPSHHNMQPQHNMQQYGHHQQHYHQPQHPQQHPPN